MNFEVFNKADIEQLYHDMLKNMTDEQKDIFIKEYGSIQREAGCGDGKLAVRMGADQLYQMKDVSAFMSYFSNN